MKFKKILLPVLALVVLLTAMAFTLTTKSGVKTPMNQKTTNAGYVYYFSYIGPSPAYFFSDYTNPNNYVFFPDDDENPYDVCGAGNEAVCMIICERVWNGFAWKPNFSDTSYGSAYWGLYNFYMSGIPATGAVILKNL